MTTNMLQLALTSALKKIGHRGFFHRPEVLAAKLVAHPDVAALRTEGMSIKAAASALCAAYKAGKLSAAHWADLDKALSD